MWWLVLAIWACAGLTLFFNLTKHAINRNHGYVQAVYLPLFIGCLLGWPIFGLYAAVARD